jgi:hypothetical protein
VVVRTSETVKNPEPVNVSLCDSTEVTVIVVSVSELELALESLLSALDASDNDRLAVGPDGSGVYESTGEVVGEKEVGLEAFKREVDIDACEDMGAGGIVGVTVVPMAFEEEESGDRLIDVAVFNGVLDPHTRSYTGQRHASIKCSFIWRRQTKRMVELTMARYI